MKTGVLRRISVSVTPETEDVICELLFNVCKTPPVVFTNLEAGTCQAQAYCELTVRQLNETRRLLRYGLKEMVTGGFDSSPVKISIHQLKVQDWAESWKRHFKAIEIGDRLLIKPSWNRRKPRSGASVIILDPGLSFGTGQHPTTRFCLEQLVRARRPETKQGFLDIGTGTGILAIAAEKLGYQPVAAFDFDPDAVRIARANAALNQAGGIRFSRKDLTKLPMSTREPFDVVCANLTYDLLVVERSKIIRRLKPGGTLLLAGILDSQFAEVAAAYRQEGLKCLNRHAVGEWTSGAFRFDE